ncbi:hypothetical protein AB0D60_34835 [Streptomyces sp. NPDC048306]|uniref:hypothetical protein n=1 Tax=Streptomyces sp. NPDC048306 TaxID=3154502 RepID=UPI0033BFD131
MMDRIPLALTGYLEDAAVTDDGVASWRLACSTGTDDLIDEAVIPCTTTQPEITEQLLTERQPGDLLRVTGHLTIPMTASGVLQLHVESLDVLWEAPLLDTDQDEDEDRTDTLPTPGTDTEHSTAITALAEALNRFAHDAPGRTIGITISPNGPLSSASDQTHILDISSALAHRLADHVNALSCQPRSQRSDDDTVVDQQTVAELTAVFNAINLTDLTRQVLNATRPETRPAVTRALDDMFGDIPVTGTDDSDQ